MARNKTAQYEAMFLFPAGAATEIENTIATARKFIEAHGGQIAVIKKWDERKLTYEVAKQKRLEREAQKAERLESKKVLASSPS